MSEVIGYSIDSIRLLRIMWWLILLLLLLGFILFLFLTPLVIDINSEKGKCEARLTGIASVNLFMEQEEFWLVVHVIGFTMRIDLMGKKKQPAHVQRERRPLRRKISARAMLRKSKALFRSFHIRQLYFDIDSDNFLLNSWLYPVFHFIDPSHRHLNINFNGRTTVMISIENNLLRVVRAVLK